MHVFLPEQLRETCQLENVFDDEVVVVGKRSKGVEIPAGDSMVWSHVYQEGGPGYEILSKDRADVKLLIEGASQNSDLDIELSLFFGNQGERKVYLWNQQWEKGTRLNIAENDRLGVLTDMKLGWFELRIHHLSGDAPLNVSGLSFHWEAANIEKAGCGLSDVVRVEGIGAKFANLINGAGIIKVEQFLHRARSAHDRRALSLVTGVPLKRIERWAQMADLFRIVGVGEQYSELLLAAGVGSVVELSDQDAAGLLKKAEKVNRQRNLVREMPHVTRVKNWIAQAQKLVPILRDSHVESGA